MTAVLMWRAAGRADVLEAPEVERVSLRPGRLRGRRRRPRSLSGGRHFIVSRDEPVQLKPMTVGHTINSNSQCVRINVGAIDAAALGPLKKQVHGRGRKNENSLLYFRCDSSGWYSFGKILKTVATRCHILKLKCTRFDLRPRPHWGN